MDFTAFKGQIHAGNFAPAYVFLGFSPAELRKVYEMLEKASPPNPATMIQRETHLAPDNVSTALVSARSMPMWGEYKLVVIDQVDTLAGASGEKMLQAILAYLQSPSEWATLIFLSEKEAGASGKLKQLGKAVEVVFAPKPQPEHFPDWIARKLSAVGLQMEPAAIQHLIEVCHQDWLAIENELEKVISAFPAGTSIGLEHLDFLVAPQYEDSVFDLLTLIVNNKTGEALELLNHLNQMKRHEQELAIGVSYWLYRQPHDLLAVKLAKEKRQGDEVLRATGVNPKAIYKIRSQVDQFTKPLLRQMLQSMEQVDRQLKSNYTSHPAILLERYIVQLAQNRTCQVVKSTKSRR